MSQAIAPNITQTGAPNTDNPAPDNNARTLSKGGLRAPHLRLQLSIAMAISAFAAVSIVILGMIGFYIYLLYDWRASLPPDALAQLDAIAAADPTGAATLETIIYIYATNETGAYSSDEGLFFIIYVAAGLIIAALLGRFLAARIARPIEAVAHAANDVASGKLDVRAEAPKGAAFEAQALVRNFNAMTASLALAEREVSSSAAAIAHELRTPLTVLHGRLQGLRDGVFEPNAATLDALIRQADTLSRIVDDLNTLSKPLNGAIALETAVIDLADEARAVITSIEPDFAALSIRIDTNFTSAIATADPARLRQALGAFLDNAKRYAASGGAVLIETGQTDEGSVYLSVSDRGPGLSQAGLTYAFDRWWREDASRSRATGGSGLGLAVVRAIAKAHGGDVAARNRPGGGAIFELTLPAATVND